jgi:hypothetical protein
MQIMRGVAAGVIAVLAACSGGGSGGETAAAVPAVDKGPHAHAVTKQFTIDGGKLNVEEKTYVDGLAMRLENGAGAVLTQDPLSACAKLAVVAHGNLDYDAARFGDKPALMLVRNEEHPQGAALLLEPYSTSTLEDALPILVTEGNALSASGDVGDAGWGSIDATKYGGEKAPHVRLDVKLPYASLDDADPLAADASAEAKWLREMRAKAAADTQSVVDASLEVDMEDYSGSSTSNAWSDVLGNWANFNVVAVAADTGCATMVVRQPGFIGGYQEAIIQTKMVGDVRKVTAAQTRSVDSIEGHYVFGRIEHPKLGGFPVLHARAAREDGVGLVVTFSDKPFANEPFEALAAKQHMLRAVSSIEYGNQYSFSHYELAGPGVPVEQIDAGNSTTNPSLDEKEIAGLIKLGEGEGTRIAVNFRLALGGQAK